MVSGIQVVYVESYAIVKDISVYHKASSKKETFRALKKSQKKLRHPKSQYSKLKYQFY